VKTKDKRRKQRKGQIGYHIQRNPATEKAATIVQPLNNTKQNFHEAIPLCFPLKDQYFTNNITHRKLYIGYISQKNVYLSSISNTRTLTLFHFKPAPDSITKHHFI
jgi:hypothetical protein